MNKFFFFFESLNNICIISIAHIIRVSQVFMAEKTSYFSTASAIANTESKSCLSNLGWRLGYTNWNITSSTLEGSVRRTSSPWVSNSAPGKPPVVASRYLRCNLKATRSDDKNVTSASLKLTRIT